VLEKPLSREGSNFIKADDSCSLKPMFFQRVGLPGAFGVRIGR
jgi:hypothetical protein